MNGTVAHGPLPSQSLLMNQMIRINIHHQTIDRYELISFDMYRCGMGRCAAESSVPHEINQSNCGAGEIHTSGNI